MGNTKQPRFALFVCVAISFVCVGLAVPVTRQRSAGFVDAAVTAWPRHLEITSTSQFGDVQRTVSPLLARN